ncbi:MAG TPA: pitrilysin family protein [Actinomycetota bacterium]|nr:pitrilysin family protein [Actinomycetota bacterium]
MRVDKTLLPSGVRVVTESMPEVRSAALGFWVGSGSRDEPSDLQGSSHFLEHLLFKGTSSRTARDIAEAFDAVGGEANAFSEKEFTCLFGRVLDRDLPMASEVLSDMLLNPLLSPDDIEAERRVILEELAMLEDTPEDLVHDVFAEALFGEHPLGREIMGTIATVKIISRSDLASFHDANYRSPNVVVAASGNLEHERVVEWAGQGFAAGELATAARVPARPKASRKLRVMNKSTEQAHLVMGGLGYPAHHPLRFAWGVLDNLLGGGMSSRLFQEIREKRGLAYSVFSFRHLFSEIGMYGIYAGTTPANVSEVLDVISTELDQMSEAGVTEEELERAKGHMKGGVVLALEDPFSRMTRLGKSEVVGSELLSLEQILATVDAVTVEDVSRVARDLLSEDRRTLAVIGPFTADYFDSWHEAS